MSAQLLRSGERTRMPAHSDPGTLTLLFQDDVGGLQIAEQGSAKIQTSAEVEEGGTFRHVTPKPGTVIVNVGYLLMRWSNGRWKNTVHRVLEPPLPLKEGSDKGWATDGHEDTTPARRSIPFFASPDPDAIVEALPGCWSEEVPKKWKPIDAGNYLSRKRDSIYA